MKLLKILLLLPFIICAQDGLFKNKNIFSRQDSLRGSITPERAWWNLKHYELSVEVFPKTKTIKGKNIICFEVLKAAKKMQIDLQNPLKISKITHQNKNLSFQREGNVYWINFSEKDSMQISFLGTYQRVRNPKKLLLLTIVKWQILTRLV